MNANRLSDIDGPFVLLDDARADGRVPARLFCAPLEIRTAKTADEVPGLIDWLETARGNDAIFAGFLSYEAGASFEPRLTAGDPVPAGPPLGWFARFSTMERIAANLVSTLLPDPLGAWSASATPQIDRTAYDEAINRVLDYINAGDIYQANLTFMATVRFGGHPLALYARLRERQRAGYGGIVWTGEHWILSFSPELFFSQRGRSLVARPMKGTARRGATASDDHVQAEMLAADPKQRAENLMIVDLIRNDLSRVAEAGSVTVPELFHVEHFPTVHQMVSSVHATLAPGKTTIDVLRQAFPCGSITGAPKIRAMEVIGELEQSPRGIYTGSIGYIAGPGEAAFNVAIRTLVIRKGEQEAQLGLGSGIVADSVAGAEWQECLIKGRFVESADAFDLIETMRFDPEDGVIRLDRHLKRLRASANELGFTFDHHRARNELQAATFRLREPAKIRMLLSRAGNVAIEVTPLPATPEEPVSVTLVPLPVDPSDWRLRHKSTLRSFYDEARRSAESFEVAFIAPDGTLSEGSFTSLFVERDGQLLTPPLADIGLLPGVLRSELIDRGRAVETSLTADDLTDGFYIGNSLRGLMTARLTGPNADQNSN